MEATGTCLCGAVRIAISGPVELAEYCHCGSCRRATGAPVMAWVGIPKYGVEIDGDSFAHFESSAGVERGFCNLCGTSLTISADDYSGVVYVAISILEDAEKCQPECHIWHSERLSWMETTDQLPRYAKFKRDEVTNQ